MFVSECNSDDTEEWNYPWILVSSVSKVIDLRAFLNLTQIFQQETQKSLIYLWLGVPDITTRQDFISLDYLMIISETLTLETICEWTLDM